MIKRLQEGFRCAILGLKLVWTGEINFKIEIVCAMLVSLLGVLLSLSALEFALIILVISCVLVAETFNTALEELCDTLRPTRDPHIAKVKDLAAAAVLLASVGAVIVGVLVFAPHL